MVLQITDISRNKVTVSWNASTGTCTDVTFSVIVRDQNGQPVSKIDIKNPVTDTVVVNFDKEVDDGTYTVSVTQPISSRDLL